jgi:hypothetical protein
MEHTCQAQRWVITPSQSNSVVEITVWARDNDRVTLRQVFAFGAWTTNSAPPVNTSNCSGLKVSSDWELVTMALPNTVEWEWPANMDPDDQTLFSHLVQVYGDQGPSSMGWEHLSTAVTLLGSIEAHIST